MRSVINGEEREKKFYAEVCVCVCVCLCMTSEDFISDKYLIYQLEKLFRERIKKEKSVRVRERTFVIDENRQIENL